MRHALQRLRSDAIAIEDLVFLVTLAALLTGSATLLTAIA